MECPVPPVPGPISPSLHRQCPPQRADKPCRQLPRLRQTKAESTQRSSSSTCQQLSACKARIGLAHIIHCLLVPRLTLKALVISSSKALLDAHFASFASIAKEWQALGSLAVESGTALLGTERLRPRPLDRSTKSATANSRRGPHLSGLSGSRTLQGKGGRRQFSSRPGPLCSSTLRRIRGLGKRSLPQMASLQGVGQAGTSPQNRCIPEHRK